MFNTAVARPVARKEMMENEDARKAMRKEWLGQHAAGVYDFSVVREYDDVVREAKKWKRSTHGKDPWHLCSCPKVTPAESSKGEEY